MLLRRVIEHVKAQNWFAVGIDFIIVVVGVFIGLQVANWNDGRSAKKAERTYLLELRAEVTANNIILGEIRDLGTITIEAGERAITFLEQDQPCTQDCWRLLVDFFHASQVAVAPVSLSVFEELQRQGLPSSERIKEVMKTYFIGTGSRAAIFQTLPQYRETVRGLIPVDAQRFLWRDCHNNDDGVEVYITDCPAAISEGEASKILENIRSYDALHQHLTYWIGTNLLDVGSNENQIEMGNAVIDAIDFELSRKK